MANFLVMPKLVIDDALANAYIKDAVKRLADQIDEDISMRMVKEYDISAAESSTPSFDHIPTDHGRTAAKRLWAAAFGDPKPMPGFIGRFDVLYGVGVIRPNTVVRVSSEDEKS